MDPSVTTILVVYAVGALVTGALWTLLGVALVALAKGEGLPFVFLYGVVIVLLWPLTIWVLLYMLWPAIRGY